mmetsp:Transcript_27938/g.50858  ORF Transcript_27938/g.50858 Transcript_27938/m.50858 type:complete len:99 (+) Transcript_27938:235-531(+)
MILLSVIELWMRRMIGNVCDTSAIQHNPPEGGETTQLRHTPTTIPVTILKSTKERIEWVMNSFPIFLLLYDARKILRINVLSTKRINNEHVPHAKTTT